MLVGPLDIELRIVDEDLQVESDSWLVSRIVTSVLDPAGVSFFHPRSDDVSLNPFCEPGEESLTNRQVWLDNLLVTASIW